jgi:hypothetical protein
VQRKVIVPKGEEYVKFSILPLIDLSHLFDNGANLTEREKKLVG